MQLVAALAVRRAHQPRARARAAQEVLPHVRLRAPGRRQRRRRRALARPAPQLPARRTCPVPLEQRRSRTRSSTRSSTRRCSRRAGAGTSTGRSWCCGSAAAGATRRRSSAWKPTTSWRRCSRRPPPARRTSPDRSRSPTTSSCARRSHDTLHEALDIDGVARAARAASSRATCACTCVDTTEPSVLAHEILTARPYAYLDDEGEIQNRRTNAVVLRARPVRRPRRRSARSTRRRSRRSRRRSLRSRRQPTSCTTCLCSLVVMPARDDWRAAVGRARRQGARHLRRASGRCDRRRARAVVRDRVHRRGTSRTGRRRRGRRRGSCAAISRSPASRQSPRWPRSTHLPAGRVASGLAVLEHEGFALPRALHSRRADATEWVARRLLARMHCVSRRRRRELDPGRDRAGLHALPAPLAARRARHAARRRERTRRDRRAARGLRGSRRGVGAGAVDAAGCATTARVGSTGCATTARSPGCV